MPSIATIAAMTHDVPWLDTDERATWISFNAMLQTLQAALDAQLKRDAGINVFEYSVMAALSESPGRVMRMSTLAVFAQGSLSRLSHAVSRLERSGWVERRPSSDDPRSTEAHLTAAGLRKVQQSAPDHVRAVRQHVFDPLTTTQAAALGRISREILGATSPDISEEVARRI